MAVSHRAAAAAALITLLAADGAFPYQAPVRIDPRSRETAAERGSSPEAFLRLDASMVLVPVQVTARSGAPITDLTGDDFHVFENGRPQQVTYFAKDDSAVSVGILLDSSASMKEKTRQAAEAASALLKYSNAEDEFFLIEFDESPRLAVPFTSDPEQVYREASHTRPFGRTSLFDAIHMALDVMKRARHDRKALVIVSDGGDNRSRRSFTSIKNDVVESDVTLYAMGIFDPADEEPDSREEAQGPDLLDRLAGLTGGRHFPVRLAELADIGERIGELLRSQYLLGYSPEDSARDGRYRSITLELAAPVGDPVYLRYRKGYFAPNR